MVDFSAQYRLIGARIAYFRKLKRYTQEELYKNVLLYSKENQVEIDFLEQMLSVLVPEMVIGRKDNVNIVSWLLTDYRMDTVDQIPELCDEEGNALKRDTRKKEGQEWGVLYKED